MALALNIDSVDQIDYLQGRSLRARQASSGTSSVDLTLIDPVTLPALGDVVEIVDGIDVLWSGVATVVKVDDFLTKALFVSVTASNADDASIIAAPFGLSDAPNGSTTFGYDDLSTTESTEADGDKLTASLSTRTPGLAAGMVIEVTNALHGWTAAEFSINELTSEFRIEGQTLYRLNLGDPKVKLSTWLASAAEDAVLPITETKITDGAVTTPKIAAGAVTTDRLDADAVIAHVINVDETVEINDEGIVITGGSLTLEDEFGSTSLDAQGVKGQIADFIALGIYNGHFRIRPADGTAIADGRNAALPFWTVARAGSPVITAETEATYKLGDSLKWVPAVNTNTMTLTSDKVQVTPGRRYLLEVAALIRRVTGGGTNTVAMRLYYYKADGSAAAIASEAGTPSLLSGAGTVVRGGRTLFAPGADVRFVAVEIIVSMTGTVNAGDYTYIDGATLHPTIPSEAVATRRNLSAAAVGGGTGFPSSPLFGDRTFRTDTKKDYFYNGAAWVGPSLDTGGTLTAAATIAPTIAANQNNWGPTGLPTAFRIRVASSGGNLDITGIVEQADGRFLMITNIGGPNITLKFNSAFSTARNRFLNAASVDRVLTTHTSVFLYYETAGGWWYILG